MPRPHHIHDPAASANGKRHADFPIAAVPLNQVRPLPNGASLVAYSGALCVITANGASLAASDQLLLKATLVVTHDKDGATATHTIHTDREHLAGLSATGLVLNLGRLCGVVASGHLFFMKGTLELADGSRVAFMETSALRRHAAGVRSINVEALLT
jgi:hypothetical protein